MGGIITRYSYILRRYLSFIVPRTRINSIWACTNRPQFNRPVVRMTVLFPLRTFGWMTHNNTPKSWFPSSLQIFVLLYRIFERNVIRFFLPSGSETFSCENPARSVERKGIDVYACALICSSLYNSFSYYYGQNCHILCMTNMIIFIICNLKSLFWFIL